MSWSSQKKKEGIFVCFIMTEGNFFNICVLSQCIVYCIHFQNIHTFTYQKTLLYSLQLLALKIFKSLQCILKGCVCYIFARLFLGLNEIICQIKKSVFYFPSKPLFVLEKIKFQNSNIFNFHDVIKKKKSILRNNLGSKQSVSEIWPVYVTL